MQRRKETERIEQDKLKHEKDLKVKRNLLAVGATPNGDNKRFISNGSKLSNKHTEAGNLSRLGTNIILEEENEHIED